MSKLASSFCFKTSKGQNKIQKIVNLMTVREHNTDDEYGSDCHMTHFGITKTYISVLVDRKARCG